MAGIAEQLRQAVLQAAIQGKLTKQMPDETVLEIEQKLCIDKKLGQSKEAPFDIPENWKWIQIGNLGASADTDSFSDGPFGSNLKREHQTQKHEVRIIQLSNIGENGWRNENEKYTSFEHLEKVIPRCEIFPGNFVIAKMMPAGRTVEVPELGTRITLGSDAMKFVPNPVLDKNYLLYAMRSQAFLNQVYADAHGITRVRTTLKGVKEYVLPIPPLAEQKRIVARVDELMARIDELEKIETDLRALHKAFPGDMKSALLQAAMQGKLTEQLPNETITDIEKRLRIDKKLSPPRDIPFDIPESWKWIQIGNLGASADTNSFSDGPFGSNLKREHQTSKQEVRIIQLSNIGENGWKDENKKYTSFEHLEKVIPRCEVSPGCFVIAKMMPAGRTIEVPELGTRITLGSDAMKFVPNPVLNKKYLLYAMRSQAFLNQVYADAHGITRVRTTLKGIKEYVLPIPPLAEQQRIVDKLDKLLPICDDLQENL